MPKKEFDEFLFQICRERGLSLRSLSINAGLSPGTVHSIINRGYEPTLFTLNRLADYLGVKRQYLWQLAGLLKDMDYEAETKFSDARLKFHFARVDKLPKAARNLVIGIIEAVIVFFDSDGMNT